MCFLFVMSIDILTAEDFGCINLDENVINMSNDRQANIYFLTYMDKTYYIKYLNNQNNSTKVGEFSTKNHDVYDMHLEFPNTRTVRLSFYTFNKKNSVKLYFYIDYPKGRSTAFTFDERMFDKVKSEKAKIIPVNYEFNNYLISSDVIERTEAELKKIMYNESIMTPQATKYCQFDSAFIATCIATDKNNDAFLILSYLKKNGQIKKYTKIRIPNEQEEYQVYTSHNRIYINLLLQTVARNWSFSRIICIDKKGNSYFKYKPNPVLTRLRDTLSNDDTSYLETYLDSLALHNKVDYPGDLKKYSADEMRLYDLFRTFYRDQLTNGYNVNSQEFNNYGTKYKYAILKHRANTNIVNPEYFNKPKSIIKVKDRLNQKYYFRPNISVPHKKIIYLSKDDEILLTDAFTNDMQQTISRVLNVNKGGEDICPNLITEVNLTGIIISNEMDEAIITTRHKGLDYKYRYRFVDDKWQVFQQ